MSTGGKRFCGSASPVDEYDITRELCAARECFLISGDEDCTVLGEEYRCGGGSVDFSLFFCVSVFCLVLDLPLFVAHCGVWRAPLSLCYTVHLLFGECRIQTG